MSCAQLRGCETRSLSRQAGERVQLHDTWVATFVQRAIPCGGTQVCTPATPSFPKPKGKLADIPRACIACMARHGEI
jgi:hypothetical protein